MGKRRMRDQVFLANQLEELNLFMPDLHSSDTLALCKVMEQNSTIRRFSIQGLQMTILSQQEDQPILWNQYNSGDSIHTPSDGVGRWAQFLDILRNNKTLETMEISFDIDNEVQPGDRVLCCEETYKAYLQKQLLVILTENNHTVSSIDFGCTYRSVDDNTEWVHPREVQHRLDLNYYKLTPFAFTGASMEGFPEAVIFAVDMGKKEERNGLVACLFHILGTNPLFECFPGLRLG